MESDDLKAMQPDDASLEALLRTAGPQAPLPDDGFSRRVIAVLPPPPQSPRQRLWVCVVGAAAGLLVVVIGVMAQGGLTPAAPPTLVSSSPEAVQALATPLALGLAALSIWYAFRHRWQQLLRF